MVNKLDQIRGWRWSNRSAGGGIVFGECAVLIQLGEWCIGRVQAGWNNRNRGRNSKDIGHAQYS